MAKTRLKPHPGILIALRLEREDAIKLLNDTEHRVTSVIVIPVITIISEKETEHGEQYEAKRPPGR